MKFTLEDSRIETFVAAYGLSETLNKLSEEAEELYLAASDAEHLDLDKCDKKRTALITEIADVLIMIARTIEKVGISKEELDVEFDYKLNRQLVRLRRHQKAGEPKAEADDRPAWSGLEDD